MSDALVSVVIPAYNAESCLPACLDSIQRQDWTNLQIIVVDDGSQDQTLAVLRRMAESDARIQVYHQENQGVSAARNRGLKHCKGEYVRFVDSDDWLPPGSIRQMVERAEETGCGMLIGGYYEVIGPVSKLRNLENRADTIGTGELLERLNLYANSFFYGVLWNKLFRRELITGCAFTVGLNWGEDFSFVMDYLHGVETVSYLKEPVYRYNRRVGGLTIRQAVNCIRHPLRNIRIKYELYLHLKRLYIAMGQYDRYRHTLWRYLFRFALNQ